MRNTSRPSRPRRARRGATLVAVAALTGGVPAAGLLALALQDWFVDASASCAAGTGSAANPFCTISEAVEAAAGGDTIRVAPGTYQENLVLDKDLTLIGTEGDDVTIVQGQSGSVVLPGSGTTIDIDGLTLTGGGGVERGAGVFVGDFADPVTLALVNSTVSGNTASSGQYNAYGGGIYNANGALTLVNTTVSNNYATSTVRGGAFGGGIFSAGGTVGLRNTTVSGNRVSGNYTLADGSAIDCVAPLTLDNCTVTQNISIGIPVAAVRGYPLDVTSSIVWANRTAFGVGGTSIEGTGTVDHSDVMTAWSGAGANNIQLDPQFVDPINGDFRLAATSPCVDAGDPAAAPAGLDVGGNPRLLDGDLDRVMVVDMGAHELDNVQLTVTGSPTPGGTLTIQTTGTAGMNVILLVGVAGEELIAPWGSVFADPHFVELFDLGTIPSTTSLPVPPAPAGASLVLQVLALEAMPATVSDVRADRAGNFSNPVELTIE